MSKNNNEGVASRKDNSTAEGESSNLTDNTVPEVSVTENTDIALAEKPANISEEQHLAKFVKEEKMETTGDENPEKMEEDKNDEEGCETAGERMVPQKKRKPEEEIQKSETGNGDAKKLKISSDKEEVLEQLKVESDADDSVTKELNENRTGVSEGGDTSKPVVKDEMQASGGAGDCEGMEGEQKEIKGCESEGERVVPKAEQKKQKPKGDTENSEMSYSGDDDKTKPSSQGGKSAVQKKSKLKDLESPGVTRTKDSENEEIDENVTGVSCREVEEKEDELPLQTAVVLRGFPDLKMTEEQAETVVSELVDRIDTRPWSRIKFSAMEYVKGGLVLTCANRSTKMWLYGAVKSIIPWPGAKLVIGDAKITVEGTRLLLWLQYPLLKKRNEPILHLLQKQNKGISTSKWRIIRRDTEGKYRERRTVWIDDESFEDLKARNFELFLGLGRVKLMQLSKYMKLLTEKGYIEREPSSSERSEPYFSDSPRPCDSDRRKHRSSDHWEPYTVHDLERRPSLGRERRPSLGRERRPSLGRERRPSLGRERRPSLGRDRRPSLGRERRASLGRDRRPSLGLDRRPSLGREPLPSRERRRSMARERRRSLARERRRSPSRERRRSPGRERRRSPGRERRSSHDRSRRSSRDHSRRSSRDHSRRSSRDRSRRSSRDRDRDHLRTSRLDETDYLPEPPDPPQISQMRHTPADLTPPRNTRYMVPISDQSDGPRFRGSGQVSMGVSRFSDLDKRLTESIQLSNLESTFLTSELPRVREFGTSELSQSQEASYSVSDPTKHRMARNTVDPTQENKYFASDLRRPLEAGYRIPDPPSLRDTNFLPGQASSQETRYTASHYASFRDSKYVTPNWGQAVNRKATITDQLTSRDSTFGVLGRPLTNTGALASALLASTEARERGFGTSQLSELGEASYDKSDRAQDRGHRNASDRTQESKYSTSDSWQSLGTGYRVPDAPQISERRFTVSDQMSSREGRYTAADRTLSHNSRNLTPRANQPENLISRAQDESIPEIAMLEELESIFLASKQSRERGFGASQPSQFQEASYLASDSARHREARDALRRPLENKYFTSERLQPRETSYRATDPLQLCGTSYMASDRVTSRDSESVAPNRVSRYVAPKWDQSENSRLTASNRPPSHDSRFGGVGGLSFEESRFRVSDQMQSKEGRATERGALYSHESRDRLSDPQQFRGFEEAMSYMPSSRNTRFPGSDFLPHQ